MDELSRAVKTFREILAKNEGAQHVAEQFATIRGRLNSVSLRLESHNILGEDQIYRWPALILSVSELEGLRAALKRELENLPRRISSP